jgi:CubicO group peptidase (beta-lactamase class C family)
MDPVSASALGASVNPITTIPNPDLIVGPGNKAQWSRADHRRHGFHNLHRIARYGLTLRAAHVMPFDKRMDLRIAELDAVRDLTALPWFSAMVVARDQHILFERYAPDFGPDRPHSIQSITKTTMNLVIGRLVEEGIVDLSKAIAHYLPEIGSGYARATVQQVLNMDVENEYSEDFTDPEATYYRHEEAMGWRLPQDPRQEMTQRRFIAQIHGVDTTNRTGRTQYKDANSDVIGWVAERAGGRPLRSCFADIVDAAGLEGVFHITTDREGFPTIDGGASLTARDLTRYMAIFARRGRGVTGERIGSESFIDRTLASGVPMPPPYDGIRYSNHLMVSGCTVGHGGWAGQYAMVNLDTGTVGVYLSVLEDEHGADQAYRGPMIRMLEEVTRRGSASMGTVLDGDRDRNEVS